MHTPKRRSASPHIGRLRPLNPSARTPLQSLPPCASGGHFAKRPMAVTCLGERAQGTASFPALARRAQSAERNQQLSSWSAERTRHADQSLLTRRTRQPAPVCPGEPDQAHRHDLAKRTQDTKQDDVTSPIGQIRQEKPPRGPAVSWSKRTGEAAPLQGGQKCQIGQNQPRAAASAKPVPSPSRLNPPTRPLLKIPLYFSCCLQGGLFLRSLRLCPFSDFERTNPSQKPSVGKESAVRRPRDLFGRTNPKTRPSQHLAKRTQAAALSRFRPNEPKRPTSPRFRQTNPRTTEPLVFPPNEPKVQPSSGLG
jgi:hypothetical protein